jgi:predicted MFS family arabinose efflux permease
MTEPAVPERARFREVLGIAEFRVLLVAQSQSRIGDQLARVALALLVYDQTSSAALTTLVYALTYLPPLLSAPWLTGLADRYPRRTVMVMTDVFRAVLVALMAIPGMPLPATAVLLVAMTCPQPLFSGARNATLPAILDGDRFPVGMSIVSTADYLAQIAGFTAGGVLVAFLGGPHVALAIDAVTYLVSAGLVRRGLGPHRPAGGQGTSRTGRFALASIGVIFGDRRLAGIAGLLWLFGFYLAPTALAAPYAHEIGAGKAAVGILMAADLPGAVLGGLLVARIPPAVRSRLMIPLAVVTGLPLLATAMAPRLPLTLLLWAGSGVLSSYMVLAQVALSRAVPDDLRARTLGVAAAGLQTAQGLGVLLAGALAEVMSPAASIAICSAAGSACAMLISVACRPGATRADGVIASAELPAHAAPQPHVTRANGDS